MKRSSSISVISIFVFILLAGNLSFAQSEYEAFTVINIADEPYKVIGDNMAYIESNLLRNGSPSIASGSELVFYGAELNPDNIKVQDLENTGIASNNYYVESYKAERNVQTSTNNQANNISRYQYVNPYYRPYGRGRMMTINDYSRTVWYDPFNPANNSIFYTDAFGNTSSRSFSSFYPGFYNTFPGNPYYFGFSSYYCPSPIYVTGVNTGVNSGEYTAVGSPSPVIVAYDEEQTLPVSSISHYAEASNKTRKRNAFIDKGGNNGIIGANEGGRSQPAIVSVKSGQLSHATVSSKNKAELLSIIRKTEFAASQYNKSVFLSRGTRSLSGKPSVFKNYFHKAPSGINNTNQSHSRIYSSPSRQKSSTLYNRSIDRSYSKSSNRSMSRPSYSAPKSAAPRSAPRPMTTKSGKNKK